MLPFRLTILFLLCLIIGTSHAENRIISPNTKINKVTTNAYYQENTLILDTEKAGNRIFAVGEQGIILYSDDIAESWKITKSGVDILLTSVFFLNKNLGWAAGHHNTILHTNNGGESWSIQSQSPKGDPLFDILFTNRTKGIAIGAFGLVYITSDGGKNWLRKNITDNDFHLYAISKTQNNEVYIAGESGTLLKSLNLKDWKKLSSAYEGTLFTITTSKNRITAAGLRGNIVQSTDNGKNWQTLSSSTIAPLQGGTTLSNGKIVFAGAGGSLFVSDKSGKLFDRVLFPINRSLSQVIQISETDLLFSGDFGLRKSPLNITLMTIPGSSSHD